MKKASLIVLFIILPFCLNILAKDKPKEKDTTDLMASSVFSGLKLRLVGPGLTSGRIVDIAVNPKNHSEYYLAVACGGVWKTTNAGQTFSPIFDGQVSFSIGCVTIDPNNPFVVWVGTGENNSQRSVSYGDGIYKSIDGGKSWTNMGLKKSEHIGKILVDPRNSNVVYVAAQGPLWGPGGDRGLYKTADGGKNWEKVLTISDNTGVSDIVFDPRCPDVIYASSYQRRRHVWTLIDGGPEGAIYKSVDAGKTFDKLTNGLPSGYVGRIGLAVSPVNPDMVYALIETADDKGGFYRSTDRGASWEKRKSYSTPGAQYYQEIVCDLKDADKVYSLETYFQVSEDGCKTFRRVGNKHRHVDDHALWIDPDDTKHLIVGGDGGLYETFDMENWRHVDNLPVTQFYRITADNSEPFYYVYGGTQDNSTWGGPSRTTNSGGITNDEWFLVVGGDGYKSQVDPKDPNIVYGEFQYGGLVRFDRKSGEAMFIQPQPEKGEAHRWNWDTPLLISPHSNTRLYFAANKLFRSDDRGNTWTTISGDLTRQIDRNQLKVMDKVWDPEAVAKNVSTSLFGNIVSMMESPVKENLIYIGTDDGLIQVTEDGGKNWRKIEKFEGVPETTYVSEVYASLHNENVVYAAYDNHKNNDFLPYILKSNDKGQTWTSIAGNLPKNGSVYTIQEDFVNPDLLFAGTEFALFFTIDGGKKWIQLKSGLPPIAVRDLELQKRENDLIVGTFGRGIYILDDYTPLRNINQEQLEKEAFMFPIKDALMYVQDDSKVKHDLGETFYRADNPPFGAIFTYYLKDSYKTKKDLRKEEEKKAEKDGKQVKYPTLEELTQEDIEEAPYLIFTITDESGYIIRKLKTSASKGINRLTWDLTYASPFPVDEKTDPNKQNGMPVLPGKYKVYLSKSINGEITQLTEPVEFTCKVLKNATLPAGNRNELVDFQKKVANSQKVIYAITNILTETKKEVKLIKTALLASEGTPKELLEKTRKIELDLNEIYNSLYGNSSISNRNENQPPSILDRCNYIIWGVWATSSDATQTQKDAYKIVVDEFTPVYNNLKNIVETDLRGIEKEMDRLGSPWTPNRFPEWKGE
ncbi:MAG: glycosyl hydrolase [Ignavibacteria bacterium GWB2_35_12]|nr:MAG: glycosyl hydrolase [Ignavibacteria bacterium GWA2_35_8]OGU39590.1 MAG: glycosyl hydrolase [Ignavibacteria bacterium GWB2_35_12]OGU86627.1 MAG: glycosyl hydrolase [Ignavibacteria bacterium RIFOXYA2_FULL_35_10]OGV23991.1 MAG: glycosyl hydrolase [Ignavibacteria bacterium RIFOXYC2_FULL_35_21]